ncbi:MAG: non-canonical purine NTP pyrophosphatase, partial [Actinomycetota bacterium]
MFKIVIATKNEGKIREIKEILNLPHVVLLTYKDFRDWPEIRETGGSFAENAILKAKTLVNCFEIAALADDSGLEVDALEGAPGILSARYAGPRCSSEENNTKLLR